MIMSTIPHPENQSSSILSNVSLSNVLSGASTYGAALRLNPEGNLIFKGTTLRGRIALYLRYFFSPREEQRRNQEVLRALLRQVSVNPEDTAISDVLHARMNNRGIDFNCSGKNFTSNLDLLIKEIKSLYSPPPSDPEVSRNSRPQRRPPQHDDAQTHREDFLPGPTTELSWKSPHAAQSQDDLSSANSTITDSNQISEIENSLESTHSVQNTRSFSSLLSLHVPQPLEPEIYAEAEKSLDILSNKFYASRPYAHSQVESESTSFQTRVLNDEELLSIPKQKIKTSDSPEDLCLLAQKLGEDVDITALNLANAVGIDVNVMLKDWEEISSVTKDFLRAIKYRKINTSDYKDIVNKHSVLNIHMSDQFTLAAYVCALRHHLNVKPEKIRAEFLSEARASNVIPVEDMSVFSSFPSKQEFHRIEELYNRYIQSTTPKTPDTFNHQMPMPKYLTLLAASHHPEDRRQELRNLEAESGVDAVTIMQNTAVIDRHLHHFYNHITDPQRIAPKEDAIISKYRLTDNPATFDINFLRTIYSSAIKLHLQPVSTLTANKKLSNTQIGSHPYTHQMDPAEREEINELYRAHAQRYRENEIKVLNVQHQEEFQ